MWSRSTCRARKGSAFCLQCAFDKPIIAYDPTFLASVMEFGPMALPISRQRQSAHSAGGLAPRADQTETTPSQCKKAQCALAQVAKVPAVSIVGWIGDQLGSHRVEVNVAHQLQSIAVGIHQKRLVAPLEQMTDSVRLRLM